MNKHTPEPWAFETTTQGDGFGEQYESVQLMGDGGNVCVAYGYGAHSTSDHLDISEADQARIVACVNALAGIDDPAEFRTQRDDLLAACEGAMLGITEQSGGYYTIGKNAVDILRAAIAKARRQA